MYYIQHNIQVDWIYVFRDHMLKAKRLTDLSFCWLYSLPVLMKLNAMLVIFMHLFCLMNPKGEKNWKIGKWIIDHIKLSIKNWNQ